MDDSASATSFARSPSCGGRSGRTASCSSFASPSSYFLSGSGGIHGCLAGGREHRDFWVCPHGHGHNNIISPQLHEITATHQQALPTCRLTILTVPDYVSMNTASRARSSALVRGSHLIRHGAYRAVRWDTATAEVEGYPARSQEKIRWQRGPA